MQTLLYFEYALKCLEESADEESSDGCGPVYRDPEAEQLAELLRKYHGKRSLVAAEPGISATTLWRRLKKYRLFDVT